MSRSGLALHSISTTAACRNGTCAGRVVVTAIQPQGIEGARTVDRDGQRPAFALDAVWVAGLAADEVVAVERPVRVPLSREGADGAEIPVKVQLVEDPIGVEAASPRESPSSTCQWNAAAAKVVAANETLEVDGARDDSYRRARTGRAEDAGGPVTQKVLMLGPGRRSG